jgi:phage repressor protein C with HTH and peptisase S24 domain
VNRHDVSVIRVSDPREKDLPNVGLVHAKDAETGASRWINTGSRSVRNAYSQWFQTTTDQADRLLMKYQVDHVDIATQEDYVRGLMNLFHRR